MMFWLIDDRLAPPHERRSSPFPPARGLYEELNEHWHMDAEQ